MAEIKELLDKLKTECEKERDMFGGSEQREFFIEIVEASDVDDLLDKYDPKTHDEKWSKEYQKPNPDVDKLMKEGRAVDFMSAGRLGVIRHYVEDELRSHIVGRARMNWNRNILGQVEKFVELDYAKKQ